MKIKSLISGKITQKNMDVMDISKYEHTKNPKLLKTPTYNSLIKKHQKYNIHVIIK